MSKTNSSNRKMTRFGASVNFTWAGILEKIRKMGFFTEISARLRKKSREKDAVFAVYAALVGMARASKLYEEWSVPDTLDGRFDSIVFHIALFNAATESTLKDREGYKSFGSDLIAVFLKDMDRSLREIGVGDLSVGKKVKKMASAYYGRAAAYGQALDAKKAEKDMAEALIRNLYRGEKVQPARAKALAGYGLDLYRHWQTLDRESISAGNIQVKP